jgi:hypothetical protein
MEIAMTDLAISRRGLLWNGAGITLVVSGGLIATTAACSAKASGAAYSPWDLWNDPAARGTPLAMVAAGVLAANPHDSQPWLFHVRDEAIEVFADTSRNLGAMDPFLREMHIGLGCALENMALAAPANGYQVEIEAISGSLADLSDRRGAAHAATVHLTRLAQPAPPALAYGAIARRHTNRYPYGRAKPLPKAWREVMAAMVDDDNNLRLVLFEDGAARAAYDAAVIESTQAIIADAPMIADSDRWIRSTLAQIEKFRSGPTLETAGLSPMTLMMARTLPLPEATKHEAWLSQTRDAQLSTAPLTGFIAVRDRYDRPTALAAGRAWQRLHLAATLAGVAMQPLNQPMEMVDRDRQLGRGSAWEQRLARVIGSAEWQPTFSFRAGMPSRGAPPSPRRALGDVTVG